MAKEIQPKDTSRAMAYEFWMKAPNPMVTFFKTLDVTNLIKVSKRKRMKFNMLLEYCIGKSAVSIKEFYILPVGDKNLRSFSLLPPSQPATVATSLTLSTEETFKTPVYFETNSTKVSFPLPPVPFITTIVFFIRSPIIFF